MLSTLSSCCNPLTNIFSNRRLPHSVLYMYILTTERHNGSYVFRLKVAVLFRSARTMYCYIAAARVFFVFPAYLTACFPYNFYCIKTTKCCIFLFSVSRSHERYFFCSFSCILTAQSFRINLFFVKLRNFLLHIVL